MKTEKRVILASKSPRRRELLSEIFENFDIIVREVDESLPRDMHPAEGVVMLAVKKGEAVSREFPDAVVISSDTLVEIDGIPLGKPRDREDAHRLLSLLSGRIHNVHTGVAVQVGGRCFSGLDTTRVEFRELSDEEIYAYIDGGEPMDKAGAYGIQGEGGKFVLGYDGRFDTVMGLSVDLVERLIAEALEGERD